MLVKDSLSHTGTDSCIFIWNHGVFGRARNSETCFLTRKNVIISSGFLLWLATKRGVLSWFLWIPFKYFFLWSIMDFRIGVKYNFGPFTFEFIEVVLPCFSSSGSCSFFLKKGYQGQGKLEGQFLKGEILWNVSSLQVLRISRLIPPSFFFPASIWIL